VRCRVAGTSRSRRLIDDKLNMPRQKGILAKECPAEWRLKSRPGRLSPRRPLSLKRKYIRDEFVFALRKKEEFAHTHLVVASVLQLVTVAA
jgi:hypothetical protein